MFFSLTMILVNLFLTFIKIGLFTLGSGYSMLVLAQRYVVETHHWLTLEEFTDVVAISEVTPGPVIVNLATFVGSKVAGLKGAAASTLGLTVFPFIILYIISIKYSQFKDYPAVQHLLAVIRPIAIALIIVAILKLFRTSIPDLKSGAIAVFVILLAYVFKVNPIFIVLAGLVFWLLTFVF